MGEEIEEVHTSDPPAATTTTTGDDVTGRGTFGAEEHNSASGDIFYVLLLLLLLCVCVCVCVFRVALFTHFPDEAERRRRKKKKDGHVEDECGEGWRRRSGSARRRSLVEQDEWMDNIPQCKFLLYFM